MEYCAADRVNKLRLRAQHSVFSPHPQGTYSIIDFSEIQTQTKLNQIVLECTHEWSKYKEKQGNGFYKSKERDYFLRTKEGYDQKGHLGTSSGNNVLCIHLCVIDMDVCFITIC